MLHNMHQGSLCEKTLKFNTQSEWDGKGHKIQISARCTNIVDMYFCYNV